MSEIDSFTDVTKQFIAMAGGVISGPAGNMTMMQGMTPWDAPPMKTCLDPSMLPVSLASWSVAIEMKNVTAEAGPTGDIRFVNPMDKLQIETVPLNATAGEVHNAVERVLGSGVVARYYAAR